MQGSNLRRLARLGGYLATHPRDIPRYASTMRKHPLDLGLPWLSYAAIDFLTNWIKPSHRVFKWGSGGSTLFFARRAQFVVGVENHAIWLERVHRALEDHRLSDKAEIRLITYSAGSQSDPADTNYCTALQSHHDVILVDGVADTRPACLVRAARWVYANGIVILDDSWRYDGMIPPLGEKRRERFASVGPGRPGVTTTDILFF